MFFPLLPVLTLAATTALSSRATAQTIIDFSEYNATTNGTVSSYLAQRGISIADYTVARPTDPYGREYTPDNVYIQDGCLNLKVTGGTPPPGGNVLSAGIRTTANNLLYGTFKTTAIATPVPGIVQGFFTYKNDTQESDIELLSSNYYTSSRYIDAGIQLTNQGNRSVPNTHVAVPYPEDPTAAAHEYTLKWEPGQINYYFDGQFLAKLDGNVPSVPSSFVWNAWSSGNEAFSSGPPTEDAILCIKKIEIYYYAA